MALTLARRLGFLSVASVVALSVGACKSGGGGSGPGPVPSGCVEFESQPAGTSFSVGQTFVDAGISIEVKPFQWSNGTWTSGGNANFDSNNQALGTGNAGRPNNCNLGFAVGRVMGVTLLLGELGGNNNITINSDFRNFANFADIDGQTIGGASVSFVQSSPPGAHNYYGTLTITGVVEIFEIGGQELWIDRVCLQP